jgi:hypothetical protein
MSNELVVIENVELVPFFTKGDLVEDLLEQIAKESRSVVHDVSTDKGRKAVKAAVTKITKSKAYLESNGKDLATEYKAIPKQIDANRKRVKDFLTDLQEEIRKPLTDWENEQKAIAEEVERVRIAEENQRVIDSDYEIALLLMEKDFNQRAEIEKQKEIERQEYERKLKEEAATAAIAEAEKKAEEEKLKAEREKQEAIEREARAKYELELAERRAKEAEEKAKQDAIEAERRAEEARLKAIKDAEEAAEMARLAEIERKHQEEERLAAEVAARETDKNHKRAINNEVMNKLIAGGIDAETAKQVVIIIAKGQAFPAKINY